MTRFWIAFIILLSCAGSVRAAFTSLTNLRYQTGTEARHVLDIHRPSPLPATPMPVILWIHGGGWLTGAKDPVPQVTEITNAGYVLAAMNYRYSSTAPFPAQIQDVKAAIRFLRANAAAYNLDPSRIAVWGQSAGAHLAALAAVTSGVSQTTLGQPFDVGANLSVSSAVQACVAYATPSYLGDAAVNDTTVSTYLGGLLPGALPTAQAANCYNPAYLGNDPPFLVVHGLADTTVPPIYGNNLHNALVAAGGSSTYVPLPGVGHTPWATSEYPRALAFFQSVLPTLPLASWRELHGLPRDGTQDGIIAGMDGIANVLKFAFNIAPNAGSLTIPNARTLAAPTGTSLSGLSGLPHFGSTGSGNQLALTFLRRKASTGPGIGYEVQASGDFTTWTPQTLDGTNSETLSIDSSWERVRFLHTPGTDAARRFFRVVVRRF
jgi:acetyl esterase/lipase